MTTEEAAAVRQAYVDKLQSEAQAESAAAVHAILAEGQKFLEEIKM